MLISYTSHRVICANGTGGYVLGEKIKEYLIKLEKMQNSFYYCERNSHIF